MAELLQAVCFISVVSIFSLGVANTITDVIIRRAGRKGREESLQEEVENRGYIIRNKVSENMQLFTENKEMKKDMDKLYYELEIREQMIRNYEGDIEEKEEDIKMYEEVNQRLREKQLELYQEINRRDETDVEKVAKELFDYYKKMEGRER